MTATLTQPSDPRYERGAAWWHRVLVGGLWGLEIMVDDHLTDPITFHPDGAVWLRPGLSPDALHWRLTQATLYFGYGLDAIETAPVPKGPRLIIPTPRH
jgi:hypothetical protein